MYDGGVSPDSQWREFRPRQSNGRWWAGGLGALVLALFVVPFVVSWGEVPVPLVAVFIVLGLGVSLLMLVPAWYYPELRYYLGSDELLLRFGPLMNDRIPLDSIRCIQRRNLRISPLSSFRFPGLALFDVHYLGDGVMRMCSTSASKDILVIATDQRRYGITPADERAFLEAIRAGIDHHPAIHATRS